MLRRELFKKTMGSLIGISMTPRVDPRTALLKDAPSVAEMRAQEVGEHRNTQEHHQAQLKACREENLANSTGRYSPWADVETEYDELLDIRRDFRRNAGNGFDPHIACLRSVSDSYKMEMQLRVMYKERRLSNWLFKKVWGYDK